MALALAEVPEANAIWDAKAEEPKIVDSVDIAIAVATDKGLITPIVKAANTKSLAQVTNLICSIVFSTLRVTTCEKAGSLTGSRFELGMLGGQRVLSCRHLCASVKSVL